VPPYDITERAFEFAVRVVRLCGRLCDRVGPSRRLGDQLLRAGTSIGANVEEGQAGQSRADFITKYTIALKEARETAYWLRLVRATVEAHANEAGELLDEAEQLKRILAACICLARDNA
jgi:four helix bundle protein